MKLLVHNNISLLAVIVVIISSSLFLSSYDESDATVFIEDITGESSISGGFSSWASPKPAIFAIDDAIELVFPRTVGLLIINDDFYSPYYFKGFKSEKYYASMVDNEIANKVKSIIYNKYSGPDGGGILKQPLYIAAYPSLTFLSISKQSLAHSNGFVHLYNDDYIKFVCYKIVDQNGREIPDSDLPGHSYRYTHSEYYESYINQQVPDQDYVLEPDWVPDDLPDWVLNSVASVKYEMRYLERAGPEVPEDPEYLVALDYGHEYALTMESHPDRYFRVGANSSCSSVVSEHPDWFSPSVEGCVFSGWIYESGKHSGEPWSPNDVIDEDVILLAIFEDLQTEMFDFMESNGEAALRGFNIDFRGFVKDLVVPAESYNGVPVTSILMDAFDLNERLVSVRLPDSVLSIGMGAFYDCSKLREVTIPNVRTIGPCAFGECRLLFSITIPDCVENIGDEAFSGLQFYTADGILLSQNAESLRGYTYTGSGDGKLYRQEAAPEQCTVTLHYRDDSIQGVDWGEFSEDRRIQVKKGDNLMPFASSHEDWFLPEIDGLKFVSWFYVKDSPSTQWEWGPEDAVRQDITLYAKFERVCSVTLHYVKEGLDVDWKGKGYEDDYVVHAPIGSKFSAVSESVEYYSRFHPEVSNFLYFGGWFYEDGSEWDSGHVIAGDVVLQAEYLKMYMPHVTDSEKRLEKASEILDDGSVVLRYHVATIEDLMLEIEPIVTTDEMVAGLLYVKEHDGFLIKMMDALVENQGKLLSSLFSNAESFAEYEVEDKIKMPVDAYEFVSESGVEKKAGAALLITMIGGSIVGFVAENPELAKKIAEDFIKEKKDKIVKIAKTSKGVVKFVFSPQVGKTALSVVKFSMKGIGYFFFGFHLGVISATALHYDGDLYLSDVPRVDKGGSTYVRGNIPHVNERASLNYIPAGGTAADVILGNATIYQCQKYDSEGNLL